MMARILGWITLALGVIAGGLALLVRIPDLQILSLILAAGLISGGLGLIRVVARST